MCIHAIFIKWFTFCLECVESLHIHFRPPIPEGKITAQYSFTANYYAKREKNVCLFVIAAFSFFFCCVMVSMGVCVFSCLEIIPNNLQFLLHSSLSTNSSPCTQCDLLLLKLYKRIINTITTAEVYVCSIEMVSKISKNNWDVPYGKRDAWYSLCFFSLFFSLRLWFCSLNQSKPLHKVTCTCQSCMVRIQHIPLAWQIWFTWSNCYVLADAKAFNNPSFSLKRLGDDTNEYVRGQRNVPVECDSGMNDIGNYNLW